MVLEYRFYLENGGFDMFKLETDKNGNTVTMKWYMDNLKDKIKMAEKEIQTLSNYTEQDLEKVIDSIINNFAIGDIVITESNELIDGYKRIIAINSFIDNHIKYNEKYYSELSIEEKKIFDNYRFRIFVL